MTMLCKKLLSGLLALMLLLTLAPAALAEETLLKVVLTGLYAQADGTYNKVEQTAVFDVYQDNQKIGALNVTPGGENTIALPGAGSVALVPVAGSYPAELPLNVYGYGVAVAANRLNIAPIEVIANVAAPAAPVVTAAPTAEPVVTAAPTAEPVVTAAPTAEPVVTAAPTATAEPTATAAPVATPVPTATMAPVVGGGLFILEAEVQASFELQTEYGEVVLSFQTDAEGMYTCEQVLPEGTYVLVMTASNEALWPEMYVDIWEGDVQTIHSPSWRPNKPTNVRAAVTVVPAGYVSPTPAPTAVPTAAPTAVITAAPAAEVTAAPTAVVTAEPAAAITAAPAVTQAPTAVPVNNAGPMVSLSVRVFEDKNNNGTQGNGEGTIRNVEVALITADGAVVATGMTAKNGEVTLSAPAGEYHLRVTAPQGYGFGAKGRELKHTHSITDANAARISQSDLIELTSKTLEVGVGLMPMGTVSGIVWNDKNGDGIYQEDEPGVPGVRMTLVGKKNGQSLETITDEDGVYTFYQAAEGVFELNCHVPDDYVFTGKVTGKANADKGSSMTTEKERIGTVDINVKSGKSYQAQQIGLMEGVIIEGVCFYDVNYNGVYDEADEPLPGVQLRLARQSNNVLLQHVVSDENGEYHFVGQRGSTFTLRANLEKGCIFTILGSGEEANMFKPNGDKTERRLTDLTIENGGYQKINLGAIKYGSIGGRVYYDDNFSSDWEKGERVLSGKVVTLYDANGEKVATKKTDKNGLFTFTKLMPGKYTVGMEPAKGYAFTSLGTNNMMQTQRDGTGRSLVIELRMGQEVTNASAGMIVPAYVSGVFFADENDNGRYDQGEKGLEGAVVRLMGENGEANTVTIGKSAEFMFSAAPGRYYLQYQLPDGGIFATVTEGGNTITGENGLGQGDWFTVGTGDTWNASPCGGLLLSDISGMAFTDSNGNSVMDADESPLAGVSITFTPSRGDLAAVSVVTGEDGRYAFNDLRPDTYILNVTCPNGSVLSRMPGMMMNIVHGKNDQTVQQKIEIGTQWHQQNMGCVVPSSWSGEVYLDENYDGVRAGDEAPAVGEQIVLMDAQTGEMVSTVLTDANGKFVIEGIAPGEYELTYPMDEGNLVPRTGSCDFYQDGDRMTNGRVVIRENEHRSGTVLAVVRTTEISGEVLLEQHDGVHPVKGATLHLLDANGSPIAEFATAEDGKYAFKGLMPDAYSVDVTIPAGYVLVENGDARLAENNLVSFVEEAQGLFGQSRVINLRMADHHKDMDVVMVLPGRLGDKVWLDLNGNGLQDGEEGGIPGVTIELLRDDKLVATTVTDQYGYFVFEQLYPTDYTLRATWPSEVKPTVMRTDLQQIVSILQEDGTSTPVRVESNKANYTADLGFVLVAEGNLPAGYGEGEAQVWKK